MINSFEVEKKLKELYETGDLNIAWGILEGYLYRKLNYSTAAQDLITIVNILANEEKASPEACAKIIEAVIDYGRDTIQKNPPVWRWIIDTEYALRTLAENPLFSDLTYFEDSVEKPRYNKAGIERLIGIFNKYFSDREYSIGRFSYTCPKTNEVVHIEVAVKKAA